MMKAGTILTFGSVCAAASIYGAVAMAQTPNQQAPQSPAQDQNAPPAQQQRRINEDNSADRIAFFEARLASVKAGLMLSDTQQSLWPPVESAVRDMVKQRQEWVDRRRTETAPTDRFERMQRAGEMMSARGAALTKLASALKPLHDSLSDDQKRRLQSLMRPIGGRMFGMDSDQRGRGMGRNWNRHDGRGADQRQDRRGDRWGMRGQHQQRWGQERGGHERGFDRDGGPGRGDGRGYGGGRGEGDNRGYGGRGMGRGYDNNGGERGGYGAGPRWRNDDDRRGYGQGNGGFGQGGRRQSAPDDGYGDRGGDGDWRRM